MERFQIKVCILHEFKLPHKAKKAYENILKAFEDDPITLRSIRML